jgi:hypothetical protein
LRHRRREKVDQYRAATIFGQIDNDALQVLSRQRGRDLIIGRQQVALLVGADSDQHDQYQTHF